MLCVLKPNISHLFTESLTRVVTRLLGYQNIFEGGVDLTRMQVEWRNADENARHNLAMEAENKRHNEQTEALTAESNALQRQANEETGRSHRATEALTAQQLNETIRHQMAQDTEALRSHQVSEQQIAQHNAAVEEISRQANAIKLATSKIASETSLTTTRMQVAGSKYVANINKAIADSKLAWQKEMDAANLALKQREVASLTDLNSAKINQVNSQIQQAWAKIAQENKQLDIEYQKLDVARYNAKTQRGKVIVDGVQQQIRLHQEKIKQRFDEVARLADIVLDAISTISD